MIQRNTPSFSVRRSKAELKFGFNILTKLNQNRNRWGGKGAFLTVVGHRICLYTDKIQKDETTAETRRAQRGVQTELRGKDEQTRKAKCEHVGSFREEHLWPLSEV